MKRIALILAMALAITGVSFAQTSTQTTAPTITVEGKLALINGTIGVKSGSKTYYLPNLGRLTGFVDGIKEGATVKAEGYERPVAMAPEYSVVRVTKLTVGGKEYDLGQGFGGGMGQGMCFGNGQGKNGGRNRW